MHAKNSFFLCFPANDHGLGVRDGEMSPSQLSGFWFHLLFSHLPLLLFPLSQSLFLLEQTLQNPYSTLAKPSSCQSSSIRPLHSSNERASPSVNFRGANEDSHLTGSEDKSGKTIRHTTHVSMVEIYRDNGTPRDTFKFTFSACPSFKLSFDLPVSVPTNRPFKRRRALSDVDGDGNEGRKKRRLRLYLITSRLSRPFSQPASNIVNRGIAKLPIWRAKNKSHGKSVLRKAAIMNRVRKRMDAAKDFMRLEQERSKARLELKDIVIQKPRIRGCSLMPSPLGRSNYDALDLEDDEELDDEEGHDGIERISSIYSDFNIMKPDTGDEEDYDYLDALDGIVPEDLPDQPPVAPTEEGMAELLREKGCEGESFFVELRD